MEYVWEALALVAMQSEALQAELEKTVADNPDLLRMNRVVAWFIACATITVEEVFNVLDYRLKNAEHTYDELIPILNQSQGGMCICRVLGIGAGVSRECFGP